MQGYSCGFGVRYIVWTNFQWCSTFYKKNKNAHLRPRVTMSNYQ